MIHGHRLDRLVLALERDQSRFLVRSRLSQPPRKGTEYMPRRRAPTCLRVSTLLLPLPRLAPGPSDDDAFKPAVMPFLFLAYRRLGKMDFGETEQ